MTARQIPPPGTKCEEASPQSHQFYIACGKPAEFIVQYLHGGEPPYAMCAACAEHNVLNRGAQYLMREEAERDDG